MNHWHNKLWLRRIRNKHHINLPSLRSANHLECTQIQSRLGVCSWLNHWRACSRSGRNRSCGGFLLQRCRRRCAHCRSHVVQNWLGRDRQGSVHITQNIVDRRQTTRNDVESSRTRCVLAGARIRQGARKYRDTLTVHKARIGHTIATAIRYVVLYLGETLGSDHQRRRINGQQARRVTDLIVGRRQARRRDVVTAWADITAVHRDAVVVTHTRRGQRACERAGILPCHETRVRHACRVARAVIGLALVIGLNRQRRRGDGAHPTSHHTRLQHVIAQAGPAFWSVITRCQVHRNHLARACIGGVVRTGGLGDARAFIVDKTTDGVIACSQSGGCRAVIDLSDRSSQSHGQILNHRFNDDRRCSDVEVDCGRQGVVAGQRTATCDTNRQASQSGAVVGPNIGRTGCGGSGCSSHRFTGDSADQTQLT